MSELWDLCWGKTVKFIPWLQSAAIPCFVSDLLLQMWAGIASFLCRSIYGCCGSGVAATGCRAAGGTSWALPHACGSVWRPRFVLLLSRIVTGTRAVSRPADRASALIPGMKLGCLRKRGEEFERAPGAGSWRGVCDRSVRAVPIPAVVGIQESPGIHSTSALH